MELDPLQVRRLVVLRAGALGDFVLTLPALGALRQRFPRARIDLIASSSAGSLAVGRGYADRLISIDEPWVSSLFGAGPTNEARSELRGADLGVVWLTRSETVAASLRAAGVSKVHDASPFPPEAMPRHIADHLLSTLAPLGIRREYAVPAIHLLPADQARAAHRLTTAGIDPDRPFVAVHPGSGGRPKNWLPERFAEIAMGLGRQIGGSVVLLVGPADDEVATRVLAEAEIRGTPMGLLRPADAVEMAAVMARAALYVGNDSGATHVAAAVGTPTIAIFGPTDPRLWAPRGSRVRIVRNPVECSPCTRQTMYDCPHRSCLTQLDAPLVLTAAALVRVTGAGQVVSPSRVPPELGPRRCEPPAKLAE